jgi:hypothetical protein
MQLVRTLEYLGCPVNPVAKWASDEGQNSTWCQFGAAVSASYVQHVLKRFYIADEVQGMYTITKHIKNNTLKDRHPD